MLNVRGFSLIEVMVALAVVGTLLMIAIPDYQEYAAVARQSEAKSELSGMYSAERNYWVETGSYTSCLSSIGVTASGMQFYTFGYGNTKANVLKCGANGSTACNTINGVSCVGGGGPGAPGITYFPANSYANIAMGTPGQAQLDNNPGDIDTGLGMDNYSAGAAGNISTRNGAVFDEWQMLGNKTLTETQSGL